VHLVDLIIRMYHTNISAEVLLTFCSQIQEHYTYLKLPHDSYLLCDFHSITHYFLKVKCIGVPVQAMAACGGSRDTTYSFPHS